MLEVVKVKFSYPLSVSPSFAYDLQVPSSGIAILEGPSGVGKSTLLNLIAGFLMPDEGLISWEGKDITNCSPADRPLSMIFQDGNLFDHLDCRKNIALGLRPSLKLSEDEWCAVDQAMAELDVLDLKDRNPNDISGGQKQRVALTRALIRAQWQDRKLLLFDEPFSALDQENRLICIEIVKRLVFQKNIAALMVSHNPDDYERLEANVITLPQ